MVADMVLDDLGDEPVEAERHRLSAAVQRRAGSRTLMVASGSVKLAAPLGAPRRLPNWRRCG
jgi:hypothetical protein